MDILKKYKRKVEQEMYIRKFDKRSRLRKMAEKYIMENATIERILPLSFSDGDSCDATIEIQIRAGFRVVRAQVQLSSEACHNVIDVMDPNSFSFKESLRQISDINPAFRDAIRGLTERLVGDIEIGNLEERDLITSPFDSHHFRRPYSWEGSFTLDQSGLSMEAVNTLLGIND